MSYERRKFFDHDAIRAVSIHAALIALGGCGERANDETQAVSAAGGAVAIAGTGRGGAVASTTAGGAIAATSGGTATSGGAATTDDAGRSAAMDDALAGAGAGGEAGEAEAAGASNSAGAGAAGAPPVVNDEAAVVSGSDPANAPLRAVAQLRVSADKACSGALVRASDDPNAPAYLLTAGWCALDPTLPNSTVVIDAESDLGVAATFGRFQDSARDPALEIRASHIAYATLKNADLALLELDRSREELAALGIEPLRIDVSPPAVGDPLRVVGVPKADLDGAYVPDDVLRESRCTALSSANVVEHHFMWFDDVVSRCPGIGTGAEGAPVLNQNGDVIAIHHRVYGGGKPNAPCFFGSPCEVGGGQPERVERGRTYAVPLSKLSGCFADDGHFDVTRDACHLESGAQLRVKDKPSLLQAPEPGATWSAELGSDTRTDIRIKTGSLEDTDCRDSAGYSDAFPLEQSDQVFDSLLLPEEEGLAVLCVVAGSATSADSWQRAFEHPTVMVSRLYAPRARLSGPQLIQMTPQQTFDIGDDVLRLYDANAAAANARLTLSMHPDATLTMDIREDREWRVEIGLNLVQPGGTTPDVAAFLICHEVGHAVGGFPFKASPEQIDQVRGLEDGRYGTVSATEGQADYFAAKECLPRLWANEADLNASFRALATPFMISQCDAVWSTSAERDICYRGAVTAEAVGRWYAPNDSLRVDTPDPTIVPGLSDGRSNQCRVDTAFQGSLCPTKFRGTAIPGLIEPYEQVLTISPAVEAAAAPDSCTEGVGSRPLCWFKPNAMPVDCSDFTADGKCVVVDGEDAVQYCSERSGLDTQVCPDHGKCVVTDYGYPTCVPR